MTTADSWGVFEDGWVAVLNEFDVPHLHMKEFGDPNGIYAKWTDEPGEVRRFLEGFVSVIEKCALTAVGTILRLDDLKRFNRDYGQNLDAYSICVYGCILELARVYPDTPTQMILDHFKHADSKIAKAKSYARTDGFYPGCGKYVDEYLVAGPLPKSDTFRNIIPIQAADFAAWEARKSSERKNGWFEQKHPAASDPAWFKSLFEWEMKRALKKRGTFSFPGDMERKSYGALDRAAHIEGATWTYETLVAAHNVRKNRVW